MFCIASFIVLSILSIFSSTNRELAKEALDCVFRRVTLRPCNTGFDEKMKAKILGKVITRSEGTARFLNRWFEPLSWIFILLFAVSIFFFARGVYFFYVYGSCNGLNATSFCVFDPKGENNQISGVGEECNTQGVTDRDLVLDGVDLTGFPQMNSGAEDKIVFIGCYECDYTRQVYPQVKQMVDKFGVDFVFLHYPVKEDTDYLSRVGYCVNAINPDAFWKMNDAFFAAEKGALQKQENIDTILTSVGVDPAEVAKCTNNPFTEDAVKRQMEEVVETRFFGTPTVFINGRALVGPKPYRVYAIMLRGLWYW